jgi:hypothetical protein
VETAEKEKPEVRSVSFTMEQLLTIHDPLHKVTAITLQAVVTKLIADVTPYLFLLPGKSMKIHSEDNSLCDLPPASTWGDLESIFGIEITTQPSRRYQGLFIRPTGALHIYEQTRKGWFSRPPSPIAWHSFPAKKVIIGLERIRGEIRSNLANLYANEDQDGGSLNRMAIARYTLKLRETYKL